MNYQIQTLNAISPAIYTQLGEHYHVSDHAEQPDAILVRSASMHDLPLAPSVLCIARAGAGTNNIPIDACTQAGVCVLNTPGANANARLRNGAGGHAALLPRYCRRHRMGARPEGTGRRH